MKILKNGLAFAISVIMTMSIIPVHAEEVAENHGTGLQAMTEERRNKLLERARIHTGDEPGLYTLAESVDNSASIYFPSIGNQGSDGSCVAYATTYYQMSYTISKELGVSCSNYTFSPNWTYSLINSGKDQGSNEFDAYDVLSDFGAAKKSEFSGTKTKIEPKATVWKSAMKYKIDPDHNGNNWDIDYFENPDDFIISAKQALASGKVLTTGSNSYWWYGDDSGESVTATVKVNGSTKTQQGIAYIYDNGKDEGRHLITIVGYDDNVKFKYGSYSTTGGFKIANSWGTGWGNSGYIWVSYDAFYSDSKNRPSSKNGYGFISSWWSEGTDENVYYTINLDDNYSPYEAKYMGEVTMSSGSLSKMILSYMGKEDKNDSMSNPWTLYDGSYYSGLPTSGYSGTMVLDFSEMAPYIESENGYWEVQLDGLNSTKLKIVDASSKTISPQSSGKKWAKVHTHEYIEGLKTYDSSKGTWERTDTCLICDSIEMSFDVKFDGIDGDVYLKRRAEDINDIVLRISCKQIPRLQYGCDGGRRTFYDKDNKYIDPIGRWLHIRILANISENAEEAKQTIYVTDKATGELISTVEDKNLAINVPYCNLLTIGGSSTVNIDNVIVRDM